MTIVDRVHLEGFPDERYTVSMDSRYSLRFFVGIEGPHIAPQILGSVDLRFCGLEPYWECWMEREIGAVPKRPTIPFRGGEHETLQEAVVAMRQLLPPRMVLDLQYALDTTDPGDPELMADLAYWQAHVEAECIAVEAVAS